MDETKYYDETNTSHLDPLDMSHGQNRRRSMTPRASNTKRSPTAVVVDIDDHFLKNDRGKKPSQRMLATFSTTVMRQAILEYEEQLANLKKFPEGDTQIDKDKNVTEYTYAFSCTSHIMLKLQPLALNGVERFAHELCLTKPKGIIS